MAVASPTAGYVQTRVKSKSKFLIRPALQAARNAKNKFKAVPPSTSDHTLPAWTSEGFTFSFKAAKNARLVEGVAFGAEENVMDVTSHSATEEHSIEGAVGIAIDAPEKQDDIESRKHAIKGKARTIMGAVLRQDLVTLHKLVAEAKRNSLAGLQRELGHALMHVIASRSVGMVRELMDLGAEPNALNCMYPITLAAIDLGDEAIVDLLIEKGVNFNESSIHGNALHSAVRTGNVNIVRKILDLKVDLNVQNGSQEATPLHVAAQYAREDCARLLLELGADLEVVDSLGRTPLHYAASRGLTQLCSALLDRGARLLSLDKDSFSPWMYAVSHMHLATAQLLAKRQSTSELLEMRSDDGKSYLHHAALAGVTACVETLLSLGAAINATCKRGKTPLMYAVTQNNTEVVKMLLKNNCSLDVVNEEGNSALSIVVDMPSNIITDIIFKLLLKAGADISGQAFLVKYAGDRHRQQLLLENGADPDIVTPEGSSALWEAVHQGSDDNTEHVQLLLDYNVSMRTTAAVHQVESTTPLLEALKRGKVNVARLLVNAGCSLNGVLAWLKSDEAKTARANTTELGELIRILDAEVKRTPSLTDLSRACILSGLGHSRVNEEIAQLEIPKLLQKYLQLNVFMQYRSELAADVVN